MSSQGAQSVLQIYRHILKAAKYFPSRKRDRIIAEIKAEFRANKNLTDPKKLAHSWAVAERGLSDLQAYLPQGQQGDNISLTLKGATTGVE
eukprot:CAMPEP_0202894654 /NCGR_PEP_ID=MMETSP1392-20130828/4010_1 /ASSEMBLY_ACC=CAM_ASM_000868 /TAXON_ID=225041 /ORGANISM="Chlamydomonas chlamydogama, Strain SAG 11-48b" /LENGTH=90 /DNA_ID=CAMNT_0049579409 /DNA_START=36 /DNA_END=308 /DNA_ORIENTATION=-